MIHKVFKKIHMELDIVLGRAQDLEKSFSSSVPISSSRSWKLASLRIGNIAWKRGRDDLAVVSQIVKNESVMLRVSVKEEVKVLCLMVHACRLMRCTLKWKKDPPGELSLLFEIIFHQQ